MLSFVEFFDPANILLARPPLLFSRIRMESCDMSCSTTGMLFSLTQFCFLNGGSAEKLLLIFPVRFAFARSLLGSLQLIDDGPRHRVELPDLENVITDDSLLRKGFRWFLQSLEFEQDPSPLMSLVAEKLLVVLEEVIWFVNWSFSKLNASFKNS